MTTSFLTVVTSVTTEHSRKLGRTLTAPIFGQVYRLRVHLKHEDFKCFKFLTQGFRGDNDPLDVCDIGEKVHGTGEVIQVKVLGILAMIDDGEFTDWKAIAMDIDDPIAAQVNSIDDLTVIKPGFIEEVTNFFKKYKVGRNGCRTNLGF